MKRSDIQPRPRYFGRYINQVADVELGQALLESRQQLDELDRNVLRQLAGLRSAPGQWTVQEIFQHLIDWERILSFRALLFARQEGSVPQGVNEKLLEMNMRAERRTLDSLLDELKLVRLSTQAMFESFTDDTLQCTGVNWQDEMSVLAMGFTIVGHQVHHLRLMAEKYYPLLMAQR